MIKINEEMIQKLSLKAGASERRRLNHNFHQSDADTMHRMLNAMEPDTYIQPHKHELPDKAEAFFCLRGRIAVIEYDDNGKVVDFILLDPLMGNFGCEIPPRRWHSIICLEPGSVAYEVKDGPYNVLVDKQFATWAPAEGQPSALDFNQKILSEIGILNK